MVSTKPTSEAPSTLQKEVASRVASLRSGDWVHAPVLGESPLNCATESLDKNIEARVLGSKGIRVGSYGAVSPSISRYFLEQEFEGLVISVDTENRQFWARLVDETDATVPDEESLFSFDEISQDDHDLIVPGALFSWYMGRTVRNRQVERNSEIRFRRVFKFSENSISIARNAAAAMYNILVDEI